MLTKRKLKEEVVKLTYRVAELEERICPCEQHDWLKISFRLYGGTGVGDELTLYKYKCKRCGKEKESIYP